MHQMRWLGLIAILALAPAAAAQTPDRFSIPGSVVAVYNLAGNVTIERGTGSNIVVEVVRGGRDAARLEVERTDVSGRPALVVRYPEGNVVYDSEGGGNTQIRVRDDGTFFGSGSRGQRVEIRRSGRGTEAHADLRILVPAGRSLELRLAVGSVAATGVEGGLDIDVAAASVRTSDTKGRLRIDTGSGRVSVNGAEGDDILVDTGSGSVEVNGIRASDLTVDTGSGSVSGRGIIAPNLGVDTGSGSVRLFEVSARDIIVDTGSGRVELDLVEETQSVMVDTGSGSVRLTVPAGLGAAVDLDTSSGGIEVDLPLRITRRERDRLIGTIGSGGGRIQIDTGSGSISITGR